MNEKELTIKLMHDMIEFVLSPREFEIYTLSKNKNKKPRHIAKDLGLENQAVRAYLVKIKKKINNHEKWIQERMKLRGLS